MRLLWTAGDRMILFGFGREKLPEMNGLYLIAKPVRRGGRKLCPVVTCREARQGESLLFVDHKPCGKPAALFY